MFFFPILNLPLFAIDLAITQIEKFKLRKKPDVYKSHFNVELVLIKHSIA